MSLVSVNIKVTVSGRHIDLHIWGAAFLYITRMIPNCKAD
jgi:hypothetical protein